MKKLFLLLLLACTTSIYAQSLSTVESLLQQGRYTEAAKQLRPLADRGNAKAQLYAAQLFFEGKGVTKSEAQGIKYAKLAAAQGNDDVAMMMLKEWQKTESSTLKSAISQVIKDYVQKYTYNKEESKTWVLFAAFLIDDKNDWSFPASPDLGWRIIEKSRATETIKEIGIRPKLYLDYVLTKSGCTSMPQYISQQSYVSDFLLDMIIDDFKSSPGSPLSDRFNPWTSLAKNGNKYALYICAEKYYDYYNKQKAKYGDIGSGCITLATSYSSKAYRAGLHKAKALADKTEAYHVGQLINYKGNLYKVFVVGNGYVNGYAAAIREPRVLTRAEAEQWIKETGTYLPNNELVLTHLLTEVAKTGEDVSGGYWIINGVCEFDKQGNFIKFYNRQDVPARLGNKHKTYLIY